MGTKLPVDATLLFKALQYQLFVAVDHCYALESEECLWLEVFGDVTVLGKTQVEVKFYSDSLTDGHSNFWNTLKNWLNDGFDHKEYQTLVLLTTQEYGAQTALKGWNDRTAAEKLNVMQKIFDASQDKLGNDDVETSKSSKSQKLQQYVMAAERRDDLLEILDRMKITTDAASLEERIHNFKTIHLKTIRDTKHQSFIDDLLGFMCGTELIATGWKITHKAFSDKLSELNKLYMKHPITFPPLDEDALKESIKIEDIKSRVFAQKINEIGGQSRLNKAALHLLIAEQTISQLYDDGVLFKSDVDRYLSNHLVKHLDGRELAMLDCEEISCEKELKNRSMKFFLARHISPVEQFCSFENTRVEFRNGVYHMLADEHPEDEQDEFHRRLWN
ncbi:hypothetical protein ACI51W_34600 (plasmid) [Pseudomonas marginalis]|jgi:hypothetical protein|uniref:hypothetical protein n=1 Tax=Gammaproteobacteria TaxID=1236 RepID=UPI00191C762A|nr:MULTISPECIES: hypothetical protein [Enterobacteriaceae]MCI2072371.1 hypothetical protein [Serratia liquefaciens]